MQPFQKILVAIDFSAHTKRVLKVAAELCRRYEAPATLLHVRQPELFSVVDSSGHDAGGPTPSLQAHIMDLLIAASHELLADGAIQVHLAMTDGRPAPAIVRFASEGGFDLIVIGTHGRSAISTARIGSVAEDVTRRATCAVTTVRLDPHRETLERVHTGL